MAEDLDDDTLAFAHRVFDLARSGGVVELRDYLDNGLPANLTNDKGDSLLILAAYHSQLEVVQELLAHGADTERVNDNGQTALGAAVFRQSEPVVRVLRDAGAKPDTGSPSAKEVAKFFDLAEMEKLLK